MPFFTVTQKKNTENNEYTMLPIANLSKKYTLNISLGFPKTYTNYKNSVHANLKEDKSFCSSMLIVKENI